MIEWSLQIDPIALWGAVLSTVLAVREYLKSRIKIEVSYNFASLPEIGNRVILRNISTRPITVKYWKLVKQKNKSSKPLTPSISEPDEFFRDLVMPEHSSTTLSFKNQDYFNYGEKALAGNCIYIHLYIVGEKRPIISKVYG